MRLSLILSIGFLMLCQVLSAAPMCMTGTLQSYIDLGAGGCTFAGATFAHFTYAPASTTGVPADKITVMPTATPGSPMLTFSSTEWHVPAGQTQDSTIKYTVSLPPSATSSDILRLQLGTAKVFGIIGSVTVNETTNVGDLSVFLRCADVCSEKTSDQLTFTPTALVLTVSDELTLTGGNGGAALDKFTATFDFCPPCV
jgi:hypothetical protein